MGEYEAGDPEFEPAWPSFHVFLSRHDPNCSKYKNIELHSVGVKDQTIGCKMDAFHTIHTIYNCNLSCHLGQIEDVKQEWTPKSSNNTIDLWSPHPAIPPNSLT